MDIRSLMSGIAVVIDDAYKREDKEHDDPIFKIVHNIENEWEIPFYKTACIPPENHYINLLHSASFVLLDWKLWPSNARELEKEGIETNVTFLMKAKEYFVPVFIFTNEPLDDVIDAIEAQAPGLYNKDDIEKNFIFVKEKADFLESSVLAAIRDWIIKNASVYTLKTWECTFYEAKRTLFSSMYERSPDWPRVFWKSYGGDRSDQSDRVDPSSSITQLINDSLLGRVKTGIFDECVLGRGDSNASRDNIRLLIAEACMIQYRYLPEDEIRTGDLFKLTGGKYLINIRPDCDCIPRDNQPLDNIELYCVQGKRMSDREVRCSYHNGHFPERISESIVFALDEGRSIRFDFKRLCKIKYETLKEKRIGRLIHPYITRIQQRYALYLQRQGLPPIPEEAVRDDTNRQ